MAKHQVYFYLEGGQLISLKATELSYQVSDEDGTLASYTIKTSPEEELSALYIAPRSIQAIVSVLLEPDEQVEPDID